MNYISATLKDTEQIARQVGLSYKNGGIIALSGEIGAGKTTFTQFLAKSLGVKPHLISPTFVVMRSYAIPQNPRGKLYHIDLYRLETTINIADIGANEILNNPNNIILIEWPDKVKDQLPKNTLWIDIKIVDNKSRKFCLRGLTLSQHFQR